MMLIILAGTVSCNEDQLFEGELYKKVFALISTDDYNIFTVVHDLDLPESVGYVAASVGGSNPTETDINVTLIHDIELFDNYNKDNFDMDAAKFAHLLSTDKYDIDSYSFTIPAGTKSGRMKIRIRPDGLSPDSVYFISLKVDGFSAYEVNPDKSDILYRVMIKNQYATQESTTNYSLRGSLNNVQIPGIKPMHPISRNKVRIMAGTIPFQSDIATINQSAILLEIDDDNKVSISSYKDMKVEQVDDDPNFPNIFKIEKDDYGKQFKTFLLNYKYTVGSTVNQMKEELRLEFKEDKY
ncbi:MAG: DUF4361 domain-containing protein [Tannerella sp.]|jgi:hypothetical protein|nr:DUF4361 domain-containing protein [Tannerella sp.]